MEVIDGWRIVREPDACGLIFATSPDYRGLLVVGSTNEELDDLIPQNIAALKEAMRQHPKP
jgi:hypothetical protein